MIMIHYYYLITHKFIVNPEPAPFTCYCSQTLLCVKEMADSAVSFLLENLSRLLNDELNLLSGVKAKINSLCKELKFIDIFLKSSIGKRNDNLVNEVVNQIRDVAFKAEDVVDIYIAEVAKHRSRKLLSKLFHMKEQIMVLHEVNDEINNIKSSIDEIYKNKERYRITQHESTNEEVVVGASESLRERRRHVEEEHVVGLVHDSAKVIQQLTQGDSRCKVVSIIGMGGLGKTTLARKIYNNNHVKGLFPTHAWGYVSNDYRPTEFLLGLLKCLLSAFEYNDMFKKERDEDEAIATSEEKLKKKLGESLKEKKYLVVLDDIWKTQVWDEIKDAFPDDKNGSRILITSRIKEVALHMGTKSPYYLPLLNEEESWQLFSKKVFGGEDCPSGLEPLGRSIVESCKGLPLAIVVLAGLVAKKETSQREWSRIKDITWHLAQDKIEAMDILKLSYDSLPQRLKPCFLYFGIYPEDYEISARELIQLWIAEGFIQPQETGIPTAQEPEDIADYYLDELVDRSLVQVASRRSDGGVKTCRIHDLLLDLCISQSKSDKFLEVCTEANINTLNYANPRRLSFHCKAESYISPNKFDQWCIRSLFFFEKEKGYLVDIFKSLKLCRLIYCKAEAFYPLSRDSKNLIHLKYLRLDAKVEDIPSCISCLCNLETLDVKYRGKASIEIWKLKRLRHLYLRGIQDATLPILPKADSKRKRSLQTLWLMSNDLQMVSLLENDIFPRLRKLVLIHIFPNRTRVSSLHHLSNLQCLKVKFLIPSNEFPPNLTKITLDIVFNDELFLTIMKTLGLLTNLRILKLNAFLVANIMFSLDCGTGEFPQLEVFQIKDIQLRRWRLEEGAMPHLRHLVIGNCEYLPELPEQLWSFTTLRQVRVLNPSQELADSLQNVKLKNDCKLFISKSE